MGRAIEVPVTLSVLHWAIEESGYDLEQIAHEINVPLATIAQWISGDSRPTLTHARKLANKLHRPLAAFLLPEPPDSRPLAVEFRHPARDERELNPSERRHIRRAARFQEIFSWLERELEIERPRTPSASVNDDPVSVASAARDVLGISATDQRRWATPSAAFDAWRAALEGTGHLVFLFSMGNDACSGFSLWDEFAPVVAINTAWNESARIFTLFHEMAHLITRTSSACVESVRATSRTDPVERWCEQFAAAFLMPATDVETTLRQSGLSSRNPLTDLRFAKSFASLYKVSLRAAVIRLIELNAATWDLYDKIPCISDKKPPGGGGRGRNRTEIREDQFGERATSLLLTGVQQDILDRSQAVELLDIPDAAFDELARTGRQAR
jgi:Zn-dependent peptidase ImmA (M78 family)/DNA-binding XRE family transcriptional regulator